MKRSSPTLIAAIAGWLAASTAVTAQTVSPAPQSDAVVLSPFQVNTSRDSGYVASSTLAGTRLNSEIWDTPAAISVFTSEFMSDIGVLDVKSSLDFALNASEDTSNYTGNFLVANDVNIQIRGFVDAAVGRNYFTWRLSSDVFNVERIDFSRGPNSVLFGVGAPGGIVNTSSKRALLGQDSARLRTRIGSWDDYRVEYDFSKTLLKDKLAVRANLLWQDKNDWREFKTSERRAGALAATYRPFKNTEFRFDGEYGDVNQVHVQPYPAGESFVAWEAAGRLISNTYGQAAGGTTGNTGTRPVWDPFAGVGPVSWNGSRNTSPGATASALANLRAAVIDESKHPRWAAISGPGWTNDFYYYNYAGFLEQRIGDNLAVEAAFNRQRESRSQNRPTGFGEVSLRVDPNAFRPTASNAVGIVTATEPNPNVGRYFIEGFNYGLLIADREIDDYRLTSSYRLDLIPRSRWLGRHDLAALVSRTETYNRDDSASSVPDTFANRDAVSGYAEVLLPLVGREFKLPLVQSFELSAAARAEHYSDFGNTVSPKFGLTWKPAGWLMVRASHSRGFRPPSLPALYRGSFIATALNSQDTYRSAVTQLLTDQGLNRINKVAGNPDLQPEKSKGVSAGVVIDVPGLRGLSLTVDYFEIRHRDILGSSGTVNDDRDALIAATQAALAAGQNINSIDLGSGTPRYQGDGSVVRLPVTQEDRNFFTAYNATRAPSAQRAAVGAIDYLRTTYFNRAEQFVNGFDLGLTYRLRPLAVGNFTLETNWTKLNSFYIHTTSTAPRTELLESNLAATSGASPKWRGNVQLNWRRDAWGAGLGLFYVGGFTLSGDTTSEATYESLGRPSYIQPVFTNGGWIYRMRGSDSVSYNAFVSHRFAASDGRRWLRHTSVRFGVNNLFNAEPPLSDDNNTYEPALYNSLAKGRMYSLSLTRKF